MSEQSISNVSAVVSSTAREKKYSIYRQRASEGNFNKAPSCVYFYYITYDGGRAGASQFRQYYFEIEDRAISYDEIPDIIKKLAINGRRPVGAPPAHGEDTSGIAWTRKCYVVFFFDHPGGELEFEDDEDPIWFGVGVATGPNHSFFDGQNFQIDMPLAAGGTDKRPAICCINHMKVDQFGNDTGYGNDPAKDKYKFSVKAKHTTIMTARGPDSGGTNMGPPTPPPAFLTL